MTANLDEQENELRDRNERLRDAIAKIRGRAAWAEKNLPALRKKLGELILLEAMGEIEAAEVNRHRFEIVYAERDIEAVELVGEHAHRLQAQINGESHKISRRQMYRREYDEIKNKVRRNPALLSRGVAEHGGGQDHAGRLRDLCELVFGNTDDADKFIAEMEPAASVLRAAGVA